MDSSPLNIHTHPLALPERPQSAGAGHWPLGRFNIYGLLQDFTISSWQKLSASQALCLSIQQLRTSHQLPSQWALQDVTGRQPIRWVTPPKHKSLTEAALPLQRGQMRAGWMEYENALNSNTALLVYSLQLNSILTTSEILIKLGLWMASLFCFTVHSLQGFLKPPVSPAGFNFQHDESR